MKKLTEHAELYRRVRHTHGEALRERWVEEGLDTGHCSVQTALYDTLLVPATGERTIIHNGLSNLIVVGFGYLVAALLCGGADDSLPLRYWAVGSGEGAFWDDLTVEQRQAKSMFPMTQLYTEVARVSTQNIFIDDNDDPSASVTNRVEVQAIFGPDVSGNLREFGIFGGDATAGANTGLMIDHKAHMTINLNVTSGLEQVLIRALRITL